MKKILQLMLITMFISLTANSQTISNLNPTSAYLGDYLEVTITGQNTHFNSASLTYNDVFLSPGSSTINSGSSTIYPASSTINYIYATNVVANSNTTLTASFNFNNNYPIGLYNLNVYNYYDGEIVKAEAFTLKTPPPPVNNEPCNATFLNSTKGLNYATYSNIGATISENIPNPDCASNEFNDIWFKVTVPSSGRLYISSKAKTLYDGGMAIYSGICNSLSLLKCNDDSGEGYMPLIDQNNLTPGNTIYIRFWGFSGESGTFDLSVSSGENLPTILSVSPNKGTQGEQLTVTITGQNTNFISSSNTINSDSSTNNVYLINSGSSTNFNKSIIYASSVNTISATSLSASFMFGSNPSETYDLLIENSTDGQIRKENAFTLNTAPPPSNDDACNATLLTVTDGLTFNTHSTLGATNSDDPIYPNCSNVPYSDVWFKVVVPSTGRLVINLKTNNYAIALYSGNCGALTIIDCNNNGNSSVIDKNNLLTGKAVFIRVWGEWSYFGNFQLAVSSGLQIPEIVNITPGSASIGENLQVTITGQNTHFVSGSGTYVYNDVYLVSSGSSTIINSGSSTYYYPKYIYSSYTSASTTNKLTANFNLSNYSASYIDLYDVYVSNSIDGIIKKINSFYITPLPSPQISNIYPKNAYKNNVIKVNIIGKHFNSASSTISPIITFKNENGISFNGSNTTILNDSVISADLTIPSTCPLGVYNVIVSNIDTFKNGFFVESITNVGYNNIYNSIKIYPTPVTNMLTITNITESFDLIEIINVSGNQMLNHKISNWEKEIKLPVEYLPNGIYFIKLSDFNLQSVYFKFIKL